MKALCTSFLKNESGSTAIEYSLIAALIAVVLIVSFGAFGGALGDLFTGNESSIGAALSGG